MNANVSAWNFANLLTLFRIILIAPFLFEIYGGRYGAALLIFFIASVSDFFDGYVARRFNQQSKLGQTLDPLADKILTTAAFIVMALPRANFPSIPVWLAIAVVGRDAVILLGSAIVYARTKFKDFKPTTSGKVNTFLELGLIVWFLWFNWMGRFTVILPLCYLIVLSSVLWSGASYIVQGARILADHRVQKKTA
ncbi:MAG: CDP-alcohol phosphatidyltransferase family protein [Acidobacteria bacterium]|nr:CDP-alcohol phosphatidyltransferase family protein [Acidobacteriota bacterium]